ERPRLTGGIGPKIGAIEDFALGLRDGLAHFEAFGQRQLVGAGDDPFGHPEHDRRALGPRHAGPGAIVERLARRADGELHVIGGRLGPDADDLAVMAGAFALDQLARLRVDRFAADHHPVAAGGGEAGIGEFGADVARWLAHGQTAFRLPPGGLRFLLLYGTVW